LLSLGIDLSTSATGLVLLESNGTKVPALRHEQCLAYPKLKGIERNKAICTSIMTLIHKHHPEKIVLEGYSLNMRKASSVIPLVEIGGLVRFLMHIDGLEWYDPTAPEVKKFATGKGNATKEVVMMWVLKRWEHTSIDNNTADAYVCAAMGLSINNLLPGMTMDMRAITGKLAVKSG
jgi:crossover junction endodeoxyribonuclease RuvC